MCHVLTSPVLEPERLLKLLKSTQPYNLLLPFLNTVPCTCITFTKSSERRECLTPGIACIKSLRQVLTSALFDHSYFHL